MCLPRPLGFDLSLALQVQEAIRSADLTGDGRFALKEFQVIMRRVDGHDAAAVRLAHADIHGPTSAEGADAPSTTAGVVLSLPAASDAAVERSPAVPAAAAAGKAPGAAPAGASARTNEQPPARPGALDFAAEAQ